MACKLDYIRSVINNNSEAERLEEIHAQIGKQAKESKLFRTEDNNLYTYNNIQKLNEARKFIGAINKQFDNKPIASLRKATFGRSILSVNVLPLSKTGTQEALFSDNQDQIKYSLKVTQALQSDKVRDPSKNIQGFYNDLKKQGISDQQLDLIKSLSPESKTKEQLLTDLLANYSYSVEIKGNIQSNPDLEFDDEGRPTGESINNLDKNTYYSNMTVPGGTNYTENEIRTPDIIPSIKGHAQFSTDNGIGWFRSDEALKGGKLLTPREQGVPLNIDEDEARRLHREYTGENLDKVIGGELTKTRRILELQSDLFQKGRERQDLAKQEIIEKNEFLESSTDDKASKFLQLLNKDQNWVRFFIQSIIQDSAKKGYENVLFPTGNTASKVEGHETLEEFKRQKEERLGQLESKKGIIESVKVEKNNEGYYVIDNPTDIDMSNAEFNTEQEANNSIKLEIEAINIEIKQLQEELKRVETEGFSALKPIHKFYEETVPNILKKLYGKENVERVVDDSSFPSFLKELEDKKIIKIEC